MTAIIRWLKLILYSTLSILGVTGMPGAWSDTVAATGKIFVTISDNQGANFSDSASHRIKFKHWLEAVSVTVGEEAPTGDITKTASDAFSLSDLISGRLDYWATVTDTESLSDTATALLKTNASDVADSSSPTDAADAVSRSLAQPSDNTAAHAEAVDLLLRSQATASDAFSYSDSGAGQLDHLATATDSVALDDIATASLGGAIESKPEDALALDDAATARLDHLSQISDTETLEDTATGSAASQDEYPFGDNLGTSFSDTVDVRIKYKHWLEEVVVEVATGGVETATPSDNLGAEFSDSATADIPQIEKSFADSVSLSEGSFDLIGEYDVTIDEDAFVYDDNATASTPEEPARYATPSDAVSLSEDISGIGKFLATVDDTVALEDTVTGGLNTEVTATPTDSNEPSDAVAADLHRLAEVSDVLGLTDTAAAREDLNTQFADSVTLDDTVNAGLGADIPASPSDAVGLSDGLSGELRHLATASDSSSPSDDVAARQVTPAQPSDALSQTDGVDSQKNCLAATTDSVALSDDVGANVGRFASDILDVLSLTDGVSAVSLTQAQPSDSSSPSDVVDGIGRNLAEASDSISAIDSVSVRIILSVQITDPQSGNWSDTATGIAVGAGDIPALPSDALALTDEITGVLKIFASLSDSADHWNESVQKYRYPETVAKKGNYQTIGVLRTPLVTYETKRYRVKVGGS